MALLLGLLWPLERLNDILLGIGRRVAIVFLIAMVAMILGQVFFRYVLSNAPAWTEEGARFSMLWMTGLMAPLAYRQGGFVAIDMLERALPHTIAAVLGLILLLISLLVLAYGVDLGINNHVFSMAGRGDSSSLRLPLDLIGGERIRFKNSWMYASLATGLGLMILVNVELVLRQIATILGQDHRLRPIPDVTLAGAD